PSQHADFPIPLRGKNPCDPGGARRRCHRFLDADGLRKGQPKHTEPIGHADAKVNRQSRWWHQPAIELGRRDDPLFGKETRRGFWDMRIVPWSFDWRRHDGLKVLNHCPIWQFLDASLHLPTFLKTEPGATDSFSWP